MSKPQSVCLYSELETYSGSISHHPSDLPRLIRELKLACLFYDVVIVHRGNLLEHRLTLPAFEALKPFVKTGLLWASAGHDAPSPDEYIRQKAEELTAFLGENYKKNVINMGRWENIKPTYWKIRRNAKEQGARVSKNIADYLVDYLSYKLSHKSNPFRQAYHLLELVQRMQDDKVFDRNLFIAKLGTLRGLLHPAD